MKVVEIFNSIDGEGKRAGLPCTFIRLFGCNLSCSYCFGENQNGRYPEVTLPDLTHKPLDKVQIGDIILTMQDGVVKETRVTNISKRKVNDFNRLAFSHTSFIVTPEHPFWIEGQWKEVKDIKPGDIGTNCTGREYSQYILDVYKDDLYEYSKQSLQLLIDNYEKFRKGNSGSHNGNYNPDKYNYFRLKDAIKKGIATQDIITGTYCDNLVVHHLDENPENDDLHNLVIISARLHNQIHTRGKSFWSKNTKVTPLEGVRVVSNRNNKTTQQLGPNKTKTVIGISCEPYNTYLIDDILVHNCDSQYACVESRTINSPYKVMSVEEIVNQVKYIGCPNITITGGEPLIHAGVDKLINALLDEGCWINIETNGTKRPPVRTEDGQLFYTMDFKTNTSGMTDKMNIIALEELTDDDVLKFVVGSVGDMEQALEVVEKFDIKAQVYVSPVWGKLEGAQIVEFLKKHKLWDWKAQAQLHKIFWEPTKRGV